MNLLMELVHFWGEKLARNKFYEITRFKKLLGELKGLKVVLPSYYIYIDENKYKPKHKKYSSFFNESNRSEGRGENRVVMEMEEVKERINLFIS
jgi:hypothetical protein